MTTAKASTTRRIKRGEDFPLTTFLHAESKIRKIRKVVMDRAAEIAAREDPDSEVYHVRGRHIREALNEFVSNSAKARELLGLNRKYKGEFIGQPEGIDIEQLIAQLDELATTRKPSRM